MHAAAIVVWVYGVLVLIGGVMGYVKAQSKPSLVAGVAFGVALITSGVLIWQGAQWAVLVTVALAGVLLFLMGIRYATTKKFMPPGLIALLSLLALVLTTLAVLSR